MRVYRSGVAQVLDYIICDCCSKCCKSNEMADNEYATLSAEWGYWSDSDGQNYEIHLCEHCFYDVLGHIKAKSIKK